MKTSMFAVKRIIVWGAIAFMFFLFIKSSIFQSQIEKGKSFIEKVKNECRKNKLPLLMQRGGDLLFFFELHLKAKMSTYN